MEYKGYIGRVEFDDDSGIFHGEVINTRDVITFQGRSVTQIRKAFKDSIEDYLAFCEERDEEPDRPFSGKFTIRVKPELHRKIYIKARMGKISLNAWVAEMLALAAKN